MKKSLLNHTIIGLLAISSLPLLNSCGSDEMSLPSVSSESSDDVPDEVIEKAQEIFNQRFAQVDDDYFQVYINYVDSLPASFEARMQESGMQQYGEVFKDSFLKGMGDNQNPHLMSATLFQLKDLSTTITASELTDADKLNNITWKGEIKVTANNVRRQRLDLIEHFRSLKESSDTIEIKYTSPTLSLGVCGTSWVEYFEAQKNQKQATSDDPLAMVNNMFSVITNQMFEQLIPGLEGSDWSEWEESKEHNFQKCTIIVKDGKVICSSEEDIDNLSGEGKSFSSLPPLTGAATGIYEQIEDRFVAIKPNIEFLKKHKILENGSANISE